MPSKDNEPAPKPATSGSMKPPRPPVRTALGLDSGADEPKGPKRETVRINLPPKPTAAPTIRLPVSQVPTVKIKPRLYALIVSLAILVTSGLSVVGNLIESSMAYYTEGPARAGQMQRFQNYATIWFAVLVIASIASIIFGILAYRRRKPTGGPAISHH